MGSRMVATRLYTVRDLERMTADEAERYELYEGVLREVEAMGGWHGEIGVELIGSLYMYLRTNPVGRVYTDSTHFVLMRDPDVVLMPDVSPRVVIPGKLLLICRANGSLLQANSTFSN